ncbi:ABC transporter ATP-binding protein [Novosphingobium sp. 9U]|uniref:ABC transporter transmembrane domain-containing protein n=1 Tax=Novosphingobium sp. 9U TaxID=2653158 RepID=UPI0012F0E8A5|nr:ABC transporter ATP-binding protein [Novosphingobium sp. 9U]VWX48326.1 Putative membrane protein [Novosphingobium sp. 9U]
MADSHVRVDWRAFTIWVRDILGPEKKFVCLGLIYGVAIGLLSLATPISVQMLINSVTNTALPAPLFTLAGVLLALLLFWALLNAFRLHLMELFRRRFFARLVADITLRSVYAQNPFFHDERRGDLFNRFFELMTIQKAVPSLLIGGFTVIFQATIGFVVTAFYHPFFLLFNLGFIACVALIWFVWAGGGMRTAVTLSQRKYEAAHWLESVGGSNGFYKSSRHLDYAMDMSERRTAGYVQAHKAHLRYAFPQAVALLVLYAVASAGLLALGGWLVIQGQLSIGQLVAAELILSSVFYGAAQLGPYVDSFYDLVAAVEELSLFHHIAQEDVHSGKAGQRLRDGGLRLVDACASDRFGPARLNLELAAGTQAIAAAEPGMERLLATLLKRHVRVASGLVTLGGADIGSLDMFRLRSDVIVLDRATIVESTARDYLSLANPQADSARVMALLRAVGLELRLSSLPDGLDTQLSSTGWPLSQSEILSLKLAGALLAQPRILVLSSIFDSVPQSRVLSAAALLREAGTTLVWFTHRTDHEGLDAWLWVGRNEQFVTAERARFTRALTAAEEGTHAVSS